MEAGLVNYIVFVVCAFICLTGATGVVFSRNPVHSALSLVATLFGIAVLFVQQAAHFLAAVQVIVYTGAIVILILFVMMLLGVDVDEDIEDEPIGGHRVTAWLAAGLLLAGLGLTFGLSGGLFGPDSSEVVTGRKSVTASLGTASQSLATPDTPGAAEADAVAADGNVAVLGRLLFTKYVFAFEATAILLTIAVVGAVVMARRPGDLQPLPTEPESLDDDFLDGIDELSLEGGSNH